MNIRVLAMLLGSFSWIACNDGGATDKPEHGVVGRPIFPGDASAPPTTSVSTPERQKASGPMTAGAFNDNLNFDAYQLFAEPFVSAQPELSQYVPTAAMAVASFAPKTKLDVAFIIDVTGSMGDELNYLKSEVDDIVSSIGATHPGLVYRLSLVAYRDKGDSFVVDAHPLDASLTNFKQALSTQRAGGGGDEPEAMDEALQAAVALPWDQAGEVARVAFLIADAPPHDDRFVAAFNAVLDLKRADVSIYPIAASGVASKAEFVMRTAAAQTGGEYIFITDDSGIGNAHAEPHIPCYQVMLLKQQIVRALEQSLGGARLEPDPAAVIRTVGLPNNGVCSVAQR